MNRRTFTALAATLACAAAPAAAQAASGPPPPPKSPSGKTVTQVSIGGFSTPTAFAFGDGQVFVSDGGSEDGKTPGGVFLIKGGTATRVAGSPAYAAGIVWHKDTLYVSAGNQLLAWGGFNGTTFATHKTIYAGPKRFPGFDGIGFGADGRLYAGVTGADHGKDSRRFARDILSFTSAGKDLTVVAKGIRQPWQMTFAPGSSSPFVSDFGQDGGKGASKVPDFIMHVEPGQDYGFATCNWLTLKPCLGAATPFKFLAPHSDPGGLGVIGDRLYFSEFGFAGNPEVLSMPLTGGPLTPVLTGFAAPIIAMGTNDGSVYVGSLSGQVFKVTP